MRVRIVVFNVVRNMRWATLFLALACGCSFAALRLYMWSQNNLDGDPFWYVSKTRLELPTGFASTFADSTNSLAAGHLNLGAWFGYHEVVSRLDLDVRKVDFDFCLEQNAYLAFLIDKSASGSSGIRISLHPTFTNVYFTASADGEFTSQRELDINGVEPDKWNHLCLQIRDQDGGVSIAVNGVPIDLGAVRAPSLCSIGFWAGNFRTLVDNVVIKQKDGAPDLRDSFFFSRNGFVEVLLSLSLLVLANLCAGTAFVWNGAHRLLPTLSAFNALLLCVMLALLFMMPVFQERLGVLSVRQTTGLFTWGHDIENRRCKEIYAEYPLTPPDNTQRILFVGGSQTYGSGATHKEDAFVRVVQDRLNEAAPGGARYECINAGIMGGRASGLYDLYESQWIHLNPKVVVLNLGINDQAEPGFADALRKFVKLNRERNIQTVFVLEAESIMDAPGELISHAAMREVGAEYSIPILESHGYMKAQSSRGFLWWDYAHPTSFGHRLIGEYLASCLASSGLLQRT